MIEVEVKARINDLTAWRDRLIAQGAQFDLSIEQHDETFALSNWADTPDHQRNILRLRQQNGDSILTLKRSGLNELAGLEIETKVEDVSAARQILLELGYVSQVIIHKTRQTARLENYTICLDEVERLGSFIEIEQMLNENEDAAAAQESMWCLLQEWGAAPDSRETRGYDTLIRSL